MTDVLAFMGMGATVENFLVLVHLFVCFFFLTKSCLSASYVPRIVENNIEEMSWLYYERATCSDSRRQLSKYVQQQDLADPWQMGPRMAIA